MQLTDWSHLFTESFSLTIVDSSSAAFFTVSSDQVNGHSHVFEFTQCFPDGEQHLKPLYREYIKILKLTEDLFGVLI